ncbi:MAG: Gfo/Idh/MocA family oxidoreductase, partial [Candidatus Bathyarchaeota archaeon]|nr:Gfo/Idh/MocA family oxidoreductase [Candidatus Bathyarchaeota archaeon]
KKGRLELIAVCDLVEAKAREKGKMYNVPYFTDVEKMLRSDMDFVDICTGDHTHHVIAKLAAESGKHMLIEKPMAITIQCCDLIINACRKAGVYYEIGENYFRTPTERAVKQIIDGGVIGSVLRTYAVDPSPANPQHQGSPFSSHSSIVGLLDMGVHRMSEIRMFAGSEAKNMTGVTKNLTSSHGFDDWGHAIAEFESGALGVCELCDRNVGGGRKIDYRQIVGTEGTIFISGGLAAGDIKLTLNTQDPREKLEVPVQKSVHTNSSMDGYDVVQSIIAKTEPKITYTNPYLAFPFREMYVSWADEIMDIAEAATHDRPPEYGANGRKDVEMCIAMYESSRKRAPIEIPIGKITSFEKRVHEAYEDTFGHNPLSF